MQLDASAGGSDHSEDSVSADRHRTASASAGFPEEKAELEWVLSHPEISRSASLVRFLSFICNKYFDGESKEIREHTIAVQALGRRESNFDSHADPIVRVTARTLRKKLQTLYRGDARDHQLQIVLPLGHYVPQFVRRGDAGGEPAVGAEAGSMEEAEAESEGPADAIDSAIADEEASSGSRQPLWKSLVLLAKQRRFWNLAAVLVVVPAIFVAGFLIGRRGNEQLRPAGEAFRWGDSVWSDEFDGASQQLPDQSKWTYDLENQAGLRSGQQEVFCSPEGGHSKECDPQHPNAFQDGAGHLVLRVEKNPNGVWTLVRISTKGLKSFQYGRIEARMKMPVGTGLGPSFVMVGANKDTVGWPACGSVDVAENVSLTPGSNGLGPTMIRSTLHGPRNFGSNVLWTTSSSPTGGASMTEVFTLMASSGRRTWSSSMWTIRQTSISCTMPANCQKAGRGCSTIPST